MNNSSNGARNLRIGSIDVDPLGCTLNCNGTTAKLSPRAMSVLAYFIDHAHATVSHEELLDTFWRGAISSSNAVHKCVSELRHALSAFGDDRIYIETVPKRGYRIVSRVSSATHENGVVIASHAALQSSVLTIAGRDAEMRFGAGDTSAAARSWLESVQTTLVALLARQGLGTLRPAQSAAPSNPFVLRCNVIAASAGGTSDVVAYVTFRNDGAIEDSFTEQFSGTINDHALQQRIASRLVSALEALLSEEHVAQMREWSTHNPHAYWAAYRGELHRRELTRERQLNALAHFRDALTEDPRFALLYDVFASIYHDLGLMVSSTAEREQFRQDMYALLRDAMRIGMPRQVLDKLQRRYQVFSFTRTFEAEAYWRSEIVKNPKDVEALRRYADLLEGAGFADESERFIDRLIELYPTYREDYELDYCTVATIRDDGEETLRRLKWNVDHFPDFTISLHALVEELAFQHRFTEAHSYLARLEATAPRWAHSAKLTLDVCRGGLPVGSAALAAVLDDPALSNNTRGRVCFLLGDVESGVRFWRNIEPGALHLKWNFHTGTELKFPRSVVTDARYQALLEDMGLGFSWRQQLRRGLEELADVTGIRPTTEVVNYLIT